MLLQYLKENYKENEPIFASDIELNISNIYLRQMIRTLCDKKQLYRYDSGIYYFKGESKLNNNASLSTSDVAYYIYIYIGKV